MHGSEENINGNDWDARGGTGDGCICAGGALEMDAITGSCFSSGRLAVGLVGHTIGGPVLFTFDLALPWHRPDTLMFSPHQRTKRPLVLVVNYWGKKKQSACRCSSMDSSCSSSA